MLERSAEQSLRTPSVGGHKLAGDFRFDVAFSFLSAQERADNALVVGVREHGEQGPCFLRLSRSRERDGRGQRDCHEGLHG